MEPEVPGSAIDSSGHRGNNREFVVAFQQKIRRQRDFNAVRPRPLSQHDAACCLKSSSSFQNSISPGILLTV
jgi:hypothetical protein